MNFESIAGEAGFEVEAMVGRGGTGTVYRAVDKRTGETVALKVLLPGADAARLRREAELLSQINHPGVARLVQVSAIGEDDVLTVEWIDGQPLADMLRQHGALPVKRAMRIFAQVSDALSAVHEAGVVHGDLSPANIMIGRDDRAVIVDFGTGQSAASATVTLEGTLAGTPRYLAPEVIEGAAPTPASDQYSAAIVLYEMLSGRWPFAGGDSIANALHEQLHSKPIPLTETDEWQSQRVDQAIERALQKDPASRFESMRELRRALASTNRTAERAGSSNGGSGSFAMAGIAAAVAALVIVAGVWWALSRDGNSEADEATNDTTVASADETTAQETTAAATLVPTEVPVEPTAEPVAAASEATEPEEPEEQQAASPSDQELLAVATSPIDSGAASLGCNLLTQFDFEDGVLEANFFGDPNNVDRDQIRPGVGLQGSAGLQIGVNDGFGKYAEPIVIDAGARYVFSGYVRSEGEIDTAMLGVSWLDSNWVQIETPNEGARIEGIEGQLTVTTAPAPEGAERALPFLFKDASPGLVFVDELVFAPADAPCAASLLESPAG